MVSSNDINIKFVILGQARNRWDGLTCHIFSIRYDNLSADKFVVYPMSKIGSFYRCDKHKGIVIGY